MFAPSGRVSPKPRRAEKFPRSGHVVRAAERPQREERTIDPSRRFTDEEFAVVLRKAVELRDAGEHDPGSPEGLTLDEMKAIAREVGIEPRAVEAAVRMMERPPESPVHALLGGPTRYRLEASVSGWLPEERLPHVLDAIRRAADHHGEADSELGSLAWKTVGEVSQLHVVVRPEGDRASVQLSADRSGAFILTWFLSVAGGMVGAGIIGAITEPTTLLGGVSLFAGMTAAGLGTARTLWARGTRRFRTRFSGLFHAVRQAVESSTEQGQDANPAEET